MAERIDREELRALIREALKEALSHEFPPPLRGRAREGGKPSARHPSPSPNPSPQGGGESARQASFSLTSGVLTETRVATLARTHTKIVVGSAVAITPLARDKARELKIGIERQKP
jgi:hypothetical protein